MARLKADRPLIHEGARVTGCRFGRFCEVGAGSRLMNAGFGDYSYCDRFADIANAEIGKFANIAAFVRIGATDHPLETAACHHFLYRSADYWDESEDDPAFFEHRRSRIARIGHDAWIGHGVVVAVGAVVMRDVAPYTIVAGCPARVLRPRQPPEIAERLIALAWWDWDHDRLRTALPDFRALPTADFLSRYGG